MGITFDPTSKIYYRYDNAPDNAGLTALGGATCGSHDYSIASFKWADVVSAAAFTTQERAVSSNAYRALASDWAAVGYK